MAKLLSGYVPEAQDRPRSDLSAEKIFADIRVQLVATPHDPENGLVPDMASPQSPTNHSLGPHENDARTQFRPTPTGRRRKRKP